MTIFRGEIKGFIDMTGQFEFYLKERVFFWKVLSGIFLCIQLSWANLFEERIVFTTRGSVQKSYND